MHPLVGEWLESPGARIRVKGQSMRPLYRDGDVLEIESVTHDTLLVGDVVVMRLERHLRVHRLVGLGPKGLRTAGDALRAPDPWQDPADFLGRVRRPQGWRGGLDALMRLITPLRSRLSP